MEIEAKYALADSREMDIILKDSFWQKYTLDSPQIEAYEARYLDTADGDVAALWASVRLRREGSEAVVTIKWPMPQATALMEAVKIRGEYNLELSQADFSAWKEELLKQDDFYAEVPAELIKIIQDKPLIPRYRADFDRYHAKLHYRSSLFEFSMDQGFLLVEQASERVSEMELELLEGQESDLYAFCQELEENFEIYALIESKFSRLLALEKRAQET